MNLKCALWYQQTDADWDMKSRMSGISLATKIKNTRPEHV